jgi:MFS family permease
MAFMQLSTQQRNHSIIALNAVSTLSQIGQYGLGTALIPMALVAKGANPEQIGLSSAAFWLGMLGGLLVVNTLMRYLDDRNTVTIGLVVSALSFASMPFIHWQWWLIPSALIGFGLGLRWIANETWLYRLAPAHARGRIIGIHETLISIAAIVAPLIIVSVSASKSTAFWIAGAIVFVSILPLFIANTLPADRHSTKNSVNYLTLDLGAKLKKLTHYFMGLGGLIAGLGGWMEGALLAFLPVYCADIGLDSDDVAWLLTILGVGAITCQFAIGWLADRKGVIWTTTLCALTGVIAITIALLFGRSFNSLAITLFMLGGIAGGLLTLGIYWATQHGAELDLTNRMQQVSIVYTCLSAAGPLAAGFIVSHTSSTSLFWQLLVIIFVLLLTLHRASKQDSLTLA